MKLFKLQYFICLASMIIMLALTSCSDSRKVSNANFAWQYEFSNTEKLIETRLYHQQEDYTVLYFRIPANLMNFIQNSEKEVPGSKLLVRYKIFKSFENNKFVDSSSVFMRFSVDQEFAPLEGKITIKTAKQKKGVIELYFIDLNKGPLFKTAIAFNTQKKEFPHHHYLLTTLSGDIIYNQHIGVLRPFVVQYNNASIKKLYLKTYPDSIDNLPPPPFQEIIKPFQLPLALDSSVMKNGDTLLPEKAGIIYIRAERWESEGLAILISEAPYPEIGFTPQLVAPVRYLSTEKEFIDLKNAPETKQALDDFWLKAGGNNEKSRELLKVYYNRVQNSNKLFSGCRQGWQTDRGMIYVIFGPPQSVFKSKDEESWIYKDNSYYSPLNFSFKRMLHPWCENEYELFRSVNYRNIWYSNIEAWRKGRVDTQKN